MPPADQRQARERVRAFGAELAQAHDRLREQVETLRSSWVDGEQPAGVDLRSQCLAFCSALATHHTEEDDGVFPVLAQSFPELTRAVGLLRQDHVVIAGLLDRLRQLTTTSASTSTTAGQDVVRELDGIAAIMDSHFTYEERALSAAFAELPPD